MFHGCLHYCIQQHHYHVSLIVVMRSDSSLFFNCSPKNVMSSCNCFIKSSEFSAKRSLPQETECLILKESTSAENDDFRESNSSNKES